jgi:hypothetical protein
MDYRRRKVTTLLMFSGLIGLILVWFAIKSPRPTPVNLNSAQAKTAPVNEGPPNSGIPPTSPPLRIETSGRLPQAVQGLRLNMTLGDATAFVPNLKQQGANTASGTTSFFGDTSLGLETTLFFKQGRLYEIEFAMDVLSPTDRDAILKDTLAQLGPPTKQIWSFPETTRLVWIDGDVRIAYSDDGSGPKNENPPRYVKLFVIHWPSYREVTEKETNNVRAQSDVIRSQSYEVFESEELVKWAEEPFVPRSLPRGVGVVQLGVMPWQARSALASDGWSRSTGDNLFCREGCERWEKGNLAVEVSFLADKVIRVVEDFGELTAEEAQNRLRRWLADYGTPVEAATFGGGRGPVDRWASVASLHRRHQGD